MGVSKWAIDFWFDPNFSGPVAATAPGRVVASQFEYYNGWFVDIDHGAGYVSRYSDLQPPGGPPVNTFVSQGQTIGTAGSSGAESTGIHLHFRVLLNGGAYKPEPMSGVRGFGNYGFSKDDGSCDYDGDSPNWVSRHPYDPQKVTDSTGNGKDDAVVFYEANGIWELAPSTGSSFGAQSGWIGGHGAGLERQFAADVNGDFRTDSVVYRASDGTWWVSISSGSSYIWPFQGWIGGHGVGSSNQFLADVNWDGRADAVVYFQHNGTWYVALSTGSSFAPYTGWIGGHGVGSNDQLLADVTGDLRADAVVFFDATGQWYVSPSTGSSFVFPGVSWISGHGIGSDRRFAADVDGDLDADAVIFQVGNGTWYVAKANPSVPRFDPYTGWIGGHGAGSDNQMLADATGDAGNKADAIVYFGQPGQGTWYVAPSTGSSFGAYSLWKSNFGPGS